MIHSYPSIYTLGHAAIADLLKGPVIVEEKIDGSQISFGKICGELVMRSKGAPINIVAPEGMFDAGVRAVQEIANRLPEGYVFRGEYLAKPKHNVLAYDRVPVQHIIIFDVQFGLDSYCGPDAKRLAAREFGFECVPELFRGVVESPEQLRALLETPSVLGGQKVEGVVIKPWKYDLFGRDKKVLMGKFVSEAFKETHAQCWTQEHKTPGGVEFVQQIAESLTTQARWQKAVIHLRELGQIEDSPRDIGKIIAAVAPDVLGECEQHIKDKLFDWAWPQIRRRLTHGLPEWYKDTLLKKQFDGQGASHA